MRMTETRCWASANHPGRRYDEALGLMLRLAPVADVHAFVLTPFVDRSVAAAAVCHLRAHLDHLGTGCGCVPLTIA
jgi:hypothetical protein